MLHLLILEVFSGRNRLIDLFLLIGLNTVVIHSELIFWHKNGFVLNSLLAFHMTKVRILMLLELLQFFIDLR